MSRSDPRRLAFDVLRAVDDKDAYVNLVLPALISERRLDARDAALATELTHGTARMRGRYDAILDRAVTQGVAGLDAPVADVLRLGTHQILAMRVPSHAAVTTSVDLARRAIGHKVTGLVNAVLRKVARRDLETWLAEVTAGLNATQALAVSTSHPEWIVEALAEALVAQGGDAEELPALLAADNAPPKVTLVARPGLCDPEELPGRPGTRSPYARILDGGDPGAIEQVRDGRAAVQDEGSQAVTLAFADVPIDGPDAAWLDLCAGPGGKAGLLGALAAQRGAHLIANEVQPHRADLVRKALQQLPDVEVTVHDGRDTPWPAGSFDRILLDAPCTGLGALRRRPEARWRRNPGDVDELTALQRALLEHAFGLLRPGGVLGYVTCSPHVAETTGLVDGVVGELGAARRIAPDRQLWPHRDGTDAMFLALLTRDA